MHRGKIYLCCIYLLVLMVFGASLNPAGAEAEEVVSLKVADAFYDIDEREPKINVPLDKKWTVCFSLPLNPATVDKDNFYITDSSQNFVNTTVRTDQDETKAIIEPGISGYQPGQEYRLHITGLVKAKSGATLVTPIIMKFTTVTEADDNPVIPVNFNIICGTTKFNGEEVTLRSDAPGTYLFVDYYLVDMDSGDNGEQYSIGFSLDAKRQWSCVFNPGNFPNGDNYQLTAVATDREGKQLRARPLTGVIINITEQEVTPNPRVTYTNYPISYLWALDAQMRVKPQIYKNGWVDATQDETSQYLNPHNYYNGFYQYQFLDLSCANAIAEEVMGSYLAGKGILAGQEKAYLEAAGEFGVSEVYLAAHSCHETGNGTSRLANGVPYNGVMVYNMFGINAVDSDPINQGAKKAYEMGWTSPELAIKGGARWISNQYINHQYYQQDTLYKMRWNPNAPATHQYATDIAWATKQSLAIKKLFDDFPEAVLKFDVPSYSDLAGPPVAGERFSMQGLPPQIMDDFETDMDDIKPFRWLDTFDN